MIENSRQEYNSHVKLVSSTKTGVTFLFEEDKQKENEFSLLFSRHVCLIFLFLSRQVITSRICSLSFGHQEITEKIQRNLKSTQIKVSSGN